MSYKWLSYVLTEDTPLYGGVSDNIILSKDKDMRKGDSCNTMIYRFSNHAGTHIDAPWHFFSGGISIEQYPADFWIFENVELVYLSGVGQGQKIDAQDIKMDYLRDNTECLLIKTDFSKFREDEVYWKNSPYFSYTLAKALKKHANIRVVGVDFISISNIKNRDEGRRVHKELLSFDSRRDSILILEDMDLRDIGDKIKKIFVVPLRVKGADGAPCGVVAEI